MSEEATAKQARRWDVPAIDGSDGKGYLTAGRLQALQKDAYDEAWQRGHVEGLAAGQQAVEDRAVRYEVLLNALCRPFDELDEAIEKQLLELSAALLKQLFRREIRLDPKHIIGVVRDAIRALPIASRRVQVHLHPDDAALVNETLSAADGELAWSVVEDPLCNRGGCRVTTENSQIDATAESRLHAVISRCLGDEREQ